MSEPPFHYSKTTNLRLVPWVEPDARMACQLQLETREFSYYESPHPKTACAPFPDNRKEFTKYLGGRNADHKVTITTLVEEKEKKESGFSKLVLKMKRVKNWMKSKPATVGRKNLGWRDLKGEDLRGDEMMMWRDQNGGQMEISVSSWSLENSGDGGRHALRPTPSQKVLSFAGLTFDKKPLPPLPLPENQGDGKEMVLRGAIPMMIKGQRNTLPHSSTSFWAGDESKMLENKANLEGMKHSPSRGRLTFEILKNKPLPPLPLEAAGAVRMIGCKSTASVMLTKGSATKNGSGNELVTWKRVDSAVDGFFCDEVADKVDAWGLESREKWIVKCGMGVEAQEMF